jgi:hypothetical protein
MLTGLLRRNTNETERPLVNHAPPAAEYQSPVDASDAASIGGWQFGPEIGQQRAKQELAAFIESAGALRLEREKRVVNVRIKDRARLRQRLLGNMGKMNAIEHAEPDVCDQGAGTFRVEISTGSGKRRLSRHIPLCSLHHLPEAVHEARIRIDDKSQ